MPSPTLAIGNTLTAYIPLDDEWIGLGYTTVRWFVSATESGSYVEVGSPGIALASGQRDYQYNDSTGNATDWFYWQVYGATPGLGPQSEPAPVGPPRITQKQVRQETGKLLDMVEIVTVASSAAGTEFISNDLINVDAAPQRYTSHFARPSSGTYAGAVRQIRRYSATADNCGYAPSTGRIIVGRTFGGVLSASDEVEIWTPLRDRDPSERVNEAMQTARLHIWWEETFYLTTDSGVTDYFMPASLFSEAQIKRVEYAARTYPDKPDWRPVGWFEMVQDGGQGLLTVLFDSLANAEFSSGTVIRIVYNRIGDRMDSEADYWSVPLEWAAAEVAGEYLKGQIVPGIGGDALAAVRAAIAAIGDSVDSYRRMYMPAAGAKVRVAR